MVANANFKPLTRATIKPAVQVLGGQSVPSALYWEVKKMVSGQMRRLVPGKLYRLQDICGDEAWAALGNAWVKRMAGRCFAHMVAIGWFPVNFVQYKRYATKRYQLKT